MKKISPIAAAVVICSALFGSAAAQNKSKRLGKVCGDPTSTCKAAENFQAFDLAFDTGKNFVIAESAAFYGIVLKSKKLSDYGDCSKPSFPERERLEIQKLFPNNKVFALNCVESGSNYYTGVAQKVVFIGVYAGDTLASANRFLSKVVETQQFPGVSVRKMKAGLNGT